LSHPVALQASNREVALVALIMMRIVAIACLVFACSAGHAGQDAERHLRGKDALVSRTCGQVMLPAFDMSYLTDAELKSPCGETFAEARDLVWECMEGIQMEVNNCTIPVDEYYYHLCGCRSSFDAAMDPCRSVTLSDSIAARLSKAQKSFKDLCAAGKVVSWVSKHIAIIIGSGLLACVLCSACIALALVCCCCSR
jgi:hypothetical protein